VKLVLEILEFYSCTIRFFSEENLFINMVKCPECKKEISIPEMEFHIGRENTGTRCKVCLGIIGGIVKKTIFCLADQNPVSIVLRPSV
jgi:hypothetical protein